MNRPRIALVIVESNDYQLAQEASAQEAAQRLEVDLEVVKIEEDAIQQSQQILRMLQDTHSTTRPNGILFEPVGTPLAQPARVAASNGIGWAVLNRENVDYVKELRAGFPTTPILTVTTGHEEVGRIQGEQVSRFMPNGGTMFYIQGPAGNDAAVERAAGMLKTKPHHVDVRSVKGMWSELSAYNAVISWLKPARIETSRSALWRLRMTPWRWVLAAHSNRWAACIFRSSAAMDFPGPASPRCGGNCCLQPSLFRRMQALRLKRWLAG